MTATNVDRTPVGSGAPGDPGDGDGAEVRHGRSRRTSATARLAALLVSPTMLVLGIVVAYPVLATVYQSLFRAGRRLNAQGFVVEGKRFVGLNNYTDVFSGPAGHRFWNAMWNTTFFTLTTVTLEAVLGVAMAVVMHQALRGRGVVRASILVPWAIPTAVSGLLWRWIFAPDGAANALLGQQILWGAGGAAAKFAVIIAEVWKTAPFVGLLVLAGLQIIPREVNEAAKVDGTNAWQRFWHVTLPLVKPALLVAVLFRMLDALRMFDLPYILIGPQKSSVETLSMLAFQQMSNTHYGSAAAYATILFCYVVLIAFVFVKLLGADVVGEARAQMRSSRNKRRLFPFGSRKVVQS